MAPVARGRRRRPDVLRPVHPLGGGAGDGRHDIPLDPGARRRRRPAQSWPYDVPCWVFTHRDLPPVAGDIRFAQGPVALVHQEMVAAAAGRNVWVVGGGDLAGQFADAGLLDEVWVQYAPVTLGSGAPLLPRRLELRLEEVARNADFACARYSMAR